MASNETYEKFLCPTCGKMLGTSSSLKSHMRIHARSTYGKQYKCDFCVATFLHFGTLSRHLLIFHKKISIIPPKETLQTGKASEVSCLVCNIMFPNNYRLERHMRKHGKWPECDFCHSIFTSKSRLNSHLQSRTSSGICPIVLNHEEYKKNLMCAVCGKLYSRKQDFSDHMSLHTGEKLHKCDYCEKRYRHRCHFLRHVKMEHKVKPIKKNTGVKENIRCDECNKTFNCKSHLKEHLRIHFDERPLKCNYCDKRFRFLSSLRKHEQSRLLKKTCLPIGVGSYKCDYCEKRFVHRFSLFKHIKALHGGYPVRETIIKSKELISDGNGELKETFMKEIAKGDKPDAQIRIYSDIDETISLPGSTKELEENCVNEISVEGNSDAFIDIGRGIIATPSTNIEGSNNSCAFPNENNDKHCIENSDQESVGPLPNCDAALNLDLHKNGNRDISTERFECTVCGKLCLTNGHLREHTRQHTGERPFKCNFCELKFGHTSTFYRHVRTVHKREPDRRRIKEILDTLSQKEVPVTYKKGLKCDLCDKILKQSCSLEEHLRTSHKEEIGVNEILMDKKIVEATECRHKVNVKCAKISLTNGCDAQNKICRRVLRSVSVSKDIKDNDSSSGFSIENNDKLCTKNSEEGCDEPLPNCDAAFESNKSNGIREVSEKRFKCTVCSKIFNDNSHLREHTRHHTGEQPFKCSFCGIKFSHTSSFYRHVRTVHKTEPDRRGVKEILDSLSQKQVSVTYRKGSNCDAALKNNAHKRFKCMLCGKLFSNKGHLREHRRQHTGEKPFKCNFCRMKFTHRSSFYRHVRTVHKTEPDKREVKEILDSLSQNESLSFEEKLLKCNLCEKSFKQTGSLQRHLRMSHKSRKHVAMKTLIKEKAVEAISSCGNSDSDIDETMSLKDNAEELEKNCVKEISVEDNSGACRDIATSSTNVEGYDDSSTILKENNDKDCIENSDGESYEHLPNFDAPLKRNLHKRFKCVVCSKLFLSKCHLREHTWLHAGEKPFKCNFCEMEFTHRSSFYRHVRTVHKTEPDKKGVQELVDSLSKKDPLHFEEEFLKCNLCEKSFKQTGSLQRHQRMSHKSKKHVAMKTLIKERSVEEEANGCCKKSNTDIDESPQENAEEFEENSDGESYEPLPNCDAAIKLGLLKNVNKDILAKRFQCAVCGKLFSNRGHLREHRWHHTGEKLFKCNLCEMMFSHRSSFYRHVRTVHKTEPDKKGVKEIFNSSLQKHPLHFEEKQLKYNPCEKGFKQSGSLQKHLRMSHKSREHVAMNTAVATNITCKSSVIVIDENITLHGNTVKLENCVNEISVEGNSDAFRDISRGITAASSTNIKGNENSCAFPKENNEKDCVENYDGGSDEPLPNCDTALKLDLHKDGNRYISTRRFKCTLCGKLFSYKGHLREHRRQHTGEKPFKCNFCRMKFTHRSSFYRHVRTVHKTEPDKREVKEILDSLSQKDPLSFEEKILKCNLCEKSFKRTRSLQRHLRMSHKSRGHVTLNKAVETDISCKNSYMDSTISLQGDNVELDENHDNEISMEGNSDGCRNTATSFTNVEGYGDSSIFSKNNNDKDCVENSDGETDEPLPNFDAPLKLNSHKRFKCTVCSKLFLTKGHLREHTWLHAGEKPFKCNFCGMEFTHRSSFYRHVRTVHKTEPDKREVKEILDSLSKEDPLSFEEELLKCNLCEKSFKQTGSLQKHLRMSHKSREHVALNMAVETNITCKNSGIDETISLHGNAVELEENCIHEISIEDNSGACRDIATSSTNVEGNDYNSTFPKDNNDRDCIENSDEGYVELLPSFDSAIKLDFFRNGNGDMSTKRFQCTLCGKLFSNRGHLREHKWHHTGEKPFKCIFCRMKFSHRSTFYRHVRTVHNTEPDKREVKEILDSLSQKEVSITYKKGLKYEPLPNCDVELKRNSHKRFKCVVCSKLFLSKGHLREHVWLHAGEKPFKCNFCGMEFTHRSSFYRHVRAVHKKEPDKKGVQKLVDSLSKKDPLHFEEEFLKCNLCEKSFKQTGSLRRHFLLSHNESPKHRIEDIMSRTEAVISKALERKQNGDTLKLECPECGKIFDRVHHLRDHMPIHTREKRHKCFFCEERFLHYSSRVQHIKKYHEGCPIPKLQRTPTRICKKNNVLCSLCGKTAKHPSDLVEHMRLHTGETPYSCEFCKTKFRYRASLFVHRRKREKRGTCPRQIRKVNKPKTTTNKLYQCRYCDKIQTSLSHLNEHVKIHAGEKPFECVCGRTFKLRGSFKRHVKEKNCPENISAEKLAYGNACRYDKFKCAFCNIEVSQLSCLKEHMKQHSREKRYSCSCGQTFKYYNNLSKHIMKGKHCLGPRWVKKTMGTCHEESGDIFKKKIFENGKIPQYKCPFCEKLLFKLSRLRDHVIRHTGLKPFHCDFCGKRFGYQSSFFKHIKNIHKGIPYSRKNGNFIDIRFDDTVTENTENVSLPTTMSENRYNVESGKESLMGAGDEIKCTDNADNEWILDNSPDNNVDSLTMERSTNELERSYKCMLCVRHFSKRSQLQAHMKTHKEESDTPFHCQFCYSGFFHKSSMQRHLKFRNLHGICCAPRKGAPHKGTKVKKQAICSKTNIYKCALCAKTFTRLSHFKVHMTRHTGVKSYKCDFCEVSLKYKNSCKRHMKTYHPEEYLGKGEPLESSADNSVGVLDARVQDIVEIKKSDEDAYSGNQSPPYLDTDGRTIVVDTSSDIGSIENVDNKVIYSSANNIETLESYQGQGGCYEDDVTIMIIDYM